ncbi:hypothetical protein [Prauserella shujinwangii]|uniref:hypothetical protein n=1 Tax=Prauserella shujinwangii TaxID=1453103 RepID=UPI000D084011|nr:hypothetical protein [Prauserella shujinwangii]
MPAREAVLRRAAFGDAPALGARELARAATARCRWLAAVVLGGQGRYAAATTFLEPLIRGRDPLHASLAAGTLASHRRQLGGHAAALPLDAAALARATAAGGPADDDGADPAGALADALLGLAADNLALGRLGVARRLLARAAEVPAGWRTRVRAGWIGAELALACGAAADAVPFAEEAARVARERGAARHSVKSGLVLAAALAATGEPGARERAAGLVATARAATAAHGLGSLGWPAAVLSAELAAAGSAAARRHRAAVTRELHALLPAADPEGRRLARQSAWVPI